MLQFFFSFSSLEWEKKTFSKTLSSNLGTISLLFATGHILSFIQANCVASVCERETVGAFLYESLYENDLCMIDSQDAVNVYWVY